MSCSHAADTTLCDTTPERAANPSATLPAVQICSQRAPIPGTYSRARSIDSATDHTRASLPETAPPSAGDRRPRHIPGDACLPDGHADVAIERLVGLLIHSEPRMVGQR